MSDRDLHAGRWLGAIVLVGVILRVWGLWFGLPHAQARPDEVEAVSYALKIAQGDLNPHFFNWPSLHLYILAFLFRASIIVRGLPGPGGATPTFETLVPLGRAYVAVAGVLTIPVLFLLARRAAGPLAAIGAAALLAVAPLHVRDSHFATTDVTMTLLVTASLWLIVEAHVRLERALPAPGAPGHGRGVLVMAAAGFVGGLAVGTKYSAAAILAAAAVSPLVLAMATRSWRRATTWTPFLAFLASGAAGFVTATPYALLDFATFRTDLLFEFAHLSGGHGAHLGRGWVRHLVFSLPHGLGPAAFVAACIGIAVALVRGGTPLRMVIAFVAAVYLTIGSGFTVFARYALPLVPAGCLLAALGVASISRLFGRVAPVFPLLLGIVAAPSLVNSVWLDVLLARTDTRVLAARWLSERLPPGSTIYQSGRVYVTLAITSPGLHEWRYDAATEHFAGAAPDALPDWLVLNRSPLAEYTTIPAPIDALARSRYVAVREFAGTTDDADPGAYDQQDAFFLPLAGFPHVLRPGPTITVYARRDVGSAGTRVP
jgi:hypothetical protein